MLYEIDKNKGGLLIVDIHIRDKRRHGSAMSSRRKTALPLCRIV